ncbi:MAG: hypothetical protein WBL63_22445 [Candidatus Acidiferrum sp.]
MGRPVTTRREKWEPTQRGNCLKLLAFFSLAFAASVLSAPSKELPTPGLVREFTASIEDVRQAVLAVQKDHIIHGTLVFDKEPTLTGAVAVDSTPLFDPWKGTGEVYYKTRAGAIAPRHFLDSADQGTIGVRYVIIPLAQDRIRVHVDAVYIESAHKVLHASDGSVEKSEMKEIKEALDSMQQATSEAADARRRELSAELVRQSYVRQKDDETTRLSSAQASEKEMEQEVAALRHELERRVKAPGADLKAAPFQSAASLKTLAAYTEVVVLIVTPHWLGVETPEGQRGWLPLERLEPLP